MLVGISAKAQEGLAVDTVFQKYSMMKGSIFISLAKDVLGEETEIDRYKCLILDDNSEIAKEITDAIMRDRFKRDKSGKEGAEQIKYKVKDGKTAALSYRLARGGYPFFEYLLYSNKNGRMTLIYIRGDFLNLDKELIKIQNLFIKLQKK